MIITLIRSVGFFFTLTSSSQQSNSVVSHTLIFYGGHPPHFSASPTNSLGFSKQNQASLVKLLSVNNVP